MECGNIFPSLSPHIMDYYMEGMEEVFDEDAFPLLSGTFYESDIDRLVIDGFPDTDQAGRIEQRTEMEHLNLSGLDLRKVGYDQPALVIAVYHPNLRTLDMSNAHGLENEECLLDIFRYGNILPHLEHIDISYVSFVKPRYASHGAFAGTLWRTLADNLLVNMSKLNRITAYGFPIRHSRHAAKIVAGGVEIEANTYSLKGAKTILKAREGSESIGASNLCHTWSRLINRRSTLAVLNDGTCRNKEFLDSLVPPYIEVDVSSLDNTGSLHYLARVSTEEAVVAFFPYFCARERVESKRLDETEKRVLKNLCERAAKDLSPEKFESLSCRIELFAITLLADCQPSTVEDARRVFGAGFDRICVLYRIRFLVNKLNVQSKTPVVYSELGASGSV